MMPGTREEACDETESLIRRSVAGDDRAFETLVRLHKRRVLGTASRFARTASDLDEIAQEVFIQLFRSLPKFDRRCSFETWVTRITIRRCYDYLRSLHRRRWFFSFDAMQDSGFDPACEEAPAPDPRIESLRLAMRQLKPDQQLVLTLLELEGYSLSEISSLTKWSEANVKVRAFRARNALREQLEKMERTTK